jgi:hypothetical protein
MSRLVYKLYWASNGRVSSNPICEKTPCMFHISVSKRGWLYSVDFVA